MNYIMKLFTIIIMTWSIPAFSQADLPAKVMRELLKLERQVMITGDTASKADLLLKKSRLYKTHNHYDEALHTLNRIPLAGTSNEVHIERAFNYFFTKEYSIALYEAWAIPAIEQEGMDTRLLYIMILLENGYWKDFKQQLKLEYLTWNLDTLDLFKKFKPPVPYSSPKISIVPSAGLFKYGYISQGILNLSLQLVFAGFAAYEIANGFYFTGTLSGVLPARRFYRGGRKLAGSKAYKKYDNSVQKLKKHGYKLITPILDSPGH